jgi:hypothetical protein
MSEWRIDKPDGSCKTHTITDGETVLSLDTDDCDFTREYAAGEQIVEILNRYFDGGDLPQTPWEDDDREIPCTGCGRTDGPGKPSGDWLSGCNICGYCL